MTRPDASPVPLEWTTSGRVSRDSVAHTEGPWVVREASYGWDVLVLDKATDRATWIAPVHGPAFKDSPHYPPKAECEANARLIAAAPEMLAALKEIPFPSTMGTAAEHYQRFYDWYKQHAEPAITLVTGSAR